MKKKFCPNCGYYLKMNYKFCPKCGYNLRKIPKRDNVVNDHLQRCMNQPNMMPVKDNNGLIFGIIFAIIIIIILLISFH